MVSSLGINRCHADFVNTLALIIAWGLGLRIPVHKRAPPQTAVLMIGTADQMFNLGALVETP
jgi:hypothetical protein